MITYEEAVRIVDEHTTRLSPESMFAAVSEGKILAEDVVANHDSPPFDNSAVDGFGRHSQDLDAEELPLGGEVRAGQPGDWVVARGQAVRILTGAPIPEGIAAVDMQEDCVVADGKVRFHARASAGQGIRRAGSDFRRGEKLFGQGERMNPASIGMALSAGHARVPVYARARTTIITTGDELIAPGLTLGPGQIYNSNEGSLFAAVRRLSARTHPWQCTDNPEEIRQKLKQALEDDDMILTCGGVSVGAYDYLKEAFKDLGIEQRFWSVAIKPGKPVFFGTYGSKLVFGLPGNPVSALVTFYLFARPSLLKMMGHLDPWSKPLKARFEGESRKKPGRMEFLRGVLAQSGSRNVVRESGGQGSHMMGAMAAANCLIHFPLEASRLRKDDVVDVTPLNWGVDT